MAFPRRTLLAFALGITTATVPWFANAVPMPPRTAVSGVDAYASTYSNTY